MSKYCCNLGDIVVVNTVGVVKVTCGLILGMSTVDGEPLICNKSALACVEIVTHSINTGGTLVYAVNKAVGLNSDGSKVCIYCVEKLIFSVNIVVTVFTYEGKTGIIIGMTDKNLRPLTCTVPLELEGTVYNAYNVHTGCGEMPFIRICDVGVNLCTEGGEQVVLVVYVSFKYCCCTCIVKVDVKEEDTVIFYPTCHIYFFKDEVECAVAHEADCVAKTVNVCTFCIKGNALECVGKAGNLRVVNACCFEKCRNCHTCCIEVCECGSCDCYIFHAVGIECNVSLERLPVKLEVIEVVGVCIGSRCVNLYIGNFFCCSKIAVVCRGILGNICTELICYGSRFSFLT